MPVNLVYNPGQEVVSDTDSFEILQLLGEGGMGRVYLARQVRLQRLVALRMVRLDGDDAHMAARLRQEAQRMAAINHPNIVRIFSFSVSHNNEPFLVMEYVEGEPLTNILPNQVRDQRFLPGSISCSTLSAQRMPPELFIVT